MPPRLRLKCDVLPTRPPSYPQLVHAAGGLQPAADDDDALGATPTAAAAPTANATDDDGANGLSDEVRLAKRVTALNEKLTSLRRVGRPVTELKRHLKVLVECLTSWRAGHAQLAPLGSSGFFKRAAKGVLGKNAEALTTLGDGIAAALGKFQTMHDDVAAFDTDVKKALDGLQTGFAGALDEARARKKGRGGTSGLSSPSTTNPIYLPRRARSTRRSRRCMAQAARALKKRAMRPSASWLWTR